MNVNLSKQKLDFDQVRNKINAKIERLKKDSEILLKAIKSIDNDQENILESNSILAQEACKIMREYSNNL